MFQGTRLSLSVLLAIVVVKVAAQSAPFTGCPLQWESNGNSCYQFVFDKTKTYQDAASACWGQGSALVSVNDFNEQRFITGYLVNHARESARVWYTSGQYISGAIKWYGDGTYTNQTGNTDYWYTDHTPKVAENRLVFLYSAQYNTFKWSTKTGLDPYNYICEIPKSEVFRIVQQTRDFDYGSNITDMSAVGRGPSFLLVSNDLVVIGNDWPAVLECAAAGNPQPTFKWYERTTVYESQDYGRVTEVKANDRYTLTGGRMTITTPDETKDAGLYQCKAENKFGSILTEPIRLSFGYLDQFSPNQQGAVTAKRSMGSYINCIEPSAKPGLVYNWYKDDATNFVRPELNRYLFASSNGNLYFSEVQDNDGGDYFCVVTLVPGFGAKLSTHQPPSRTSKAIRLVVESNSAQEYGPIIHPDFINVYPAPPMIGDEVRMECFAFGRMPLRYSWFRDGRDFPEGTYFQYDNRVLVIPKAKLTDGGNYTCKVEKLSGIQRVVFKSFVLNLETRPYFVVPIKHMHADVDSELTWRCEVVAIPRATYSWYKNSELLKRVPGEIEIRENVLVIRRLSPDRDNGMYQCMATNSHGTSVSSAQLRVLSIKPTFFKYLLPTSLAASQGGNLTIRCTPEAAPAPQITWLHNGGQLGVGDRIQIRIDGTLHMTGVTPADRGMYTCKASNIFGESQSTTEVMVYGGLHFIRKPVDQIGKVNTTVFLFCEISYDYNSYDLAYVWKFNGHTIDLKHNMFFREGDRENPGLYIVNAQYRHSGVYECIGESVTTSISAEARVTVTGSPGQPAGVFVESRFIQNSSLRLDWTWNPYANHGFPVTFFEVEAWTEFSQRWDIILSDIPAYMTKVDTQDSGTRRFVQVENLQPYNSYRFRVRAKNLMGVGPPSKPSEYYRIPAAAPRFAPTGVGGGGGAVGLLCMRWQPLRREEEGGDKFGYTVYWKLSSDTQGIPKQKYVGNKTSHCVTVGEQNFYMLYTVQVRANNSKGQGPISSIGYAYSAEGMPEVRVNNVKYMPINSTAIYVTWDQVPSDRETVKGKVLGYEIDYWIDQNNTLGVDSLWGHWFNRSYVYCDCGKALIIGLRPNTRYWVRVEVFTSAGKGAPSGRYLAITYLKPTSHYPQYVDVFSDGPHSVRVTWRGVNIDVGEDSVLGYKLLYWPVGDDIRTANFTTTDSPTDTDTVIHGLQQDTIYKLRVMAVNRGGDGKKSPTQYFSILKGGTLNVNRASFDPSISQILVSTGSVPFRSYTTMALLSVLHVVISILT